MDPETVQALVAAYATADALRQALKLSEWTHGWSRSSCSGQVKGGRLDADQLGSLAAMGCRIHVSLDTGRLHLRALAERSPIFAIDSDGDFTDVADDARAASSAAEAAVGQNLERLLEVLPEVDLSVELTVLGNVNGLTWIATTPTLLGFYDNSGWLAFSALIGEAVSTGRLVILDAGSGEIRCPGWIIHGPDSWPEGYEPQDTSESSASDKRDFRADYPAPDALLPVHTSDSLLSVANTLRSTAAALALLCLADTARKDDGDVSASFHGNRPLVFEVTAAPPESAGLSVDLWQWTAESGHPGRRQATIQAITMQVETADDFYERARVIHDTAEFLFAISQSGLVQEAIAARRGARDSALAAARSAAERARSGARTAIDRAIVVMGAGVGIVLANRGDLIDLPIAVALLVLASVLVVGAAVLALFFELPGAAGVIKAFREDLAHQTEVLTRRDAEQIGRLPSLIDAERDIKRAKTAVWVIISLAAIALALLYVVLLSGVGDEVDTASVPSVFAFAPELF